MRFWADRGVKVTKRMVGGRLEAVSSQLPNDIIIPKAPITSLLHFSNIHC